MSQGPLLRARSDALRVDGLGKGAQMDLGEPCGVSNKKSASKLALGRALRSDGGPCCRPIESN